MNIFLTTVHLKALPSSFRRTTTVFYQVNAGSNNASRSVDARIPSHQNASQKNAQKVPIGQWLLEPPMVNSSPSILPRSCSSAGGGVGNQRKMVDE